MKPAVRIILGIVLALAIAGGSFYSGTVYGKGQATASAAAFIPGGASGQRPQFAQGGTGTTVQGQTTGMLFGKIKSVNDDGLLVTDNDGNEITIKVASTTLIEKNMSVKVTDLEEGETVIISGKKADDGSITARSLQVAPEGRFNAQGGAQLAPQDRTGQGEGGFPGGAVPGGPGGVPQGSAPAAP